MSPLSSPELTRLRELLADEILGQLDASDESELESLRSRATDEQQAEIDRTFGELLLAIAEQSDEAMPADAKQRLVKRGTGSAQTRNEVAPAPVVTVRPGMGTMGKLGWAAAIAASVVAAVAWFNRPAPLPQPSPIETVATAPGTVQIELAPQGTLAENVSETSEVLWNADLQQGFLRLSGVPENDPTLEQYQLWIFDATRGEFAVDGGVFDISGATERDAQGRLLVPFTPKLSVGDPTAFAVTRERPGGVVVTDTSGLILIGQPSGS